MPLGSRRARAASEDEKKNFKGMIPFEMWTPKEGKPRHENARIPPAGGSSPARGESYAVSAAPKSGVFIDCMFRNDPWLMWMTMMMMMMLEVCVNINMSKEERKEPPRRMGDPGATPQQRKRFRSRTNEPKLFIS